MWNFKKLASNEDGNVAMMFGLTMTALLVVIGVGMDYTNIVKLKSELQAQVDAAVLAAATVDVTTDGNNGENETQAVSYTHLTLPTTPYV